METAYKIKNKEGLYSAGGCPPQFDRRGGKLWKSKRALMSHLALFNEFPPRWYRDCMLEEYTLELTREVFLPFWEEPEKAAQRRRDQQEKEEARLEVWRTEQEMNQYKELEQSLRKKGLIS